MPIQISKRQAKAADRMGGITLLVPWPAELGEPPELEDDTEVDADLAAASWITRHVVPPCRAMGLQVSTRVKVARAYGLIHGERRQGWTTRLAVGIVGERWAGAGGRHYDPIRRDYWYLGDMPD